MKIWVLGASGMIGSLVVKRAREKGICVVGSSKQEVDVRSLDQLRSFAEKIEPTHLINCAAYTDVDGAEKNRDLAFAVNAEGAGNCAQVAQERGIHLLHLSTDYVFSVGSVPYLETDVCAPINVYGESKRAGEVAVLAINPSACIVRTSWIFGAQSKNLISSLLTKFCSEKELRVVSDQVGRPTYCSDLVEALFSLLDAQGIIHFANEGAASRYQIALSLLDLAKQFNLPVICKNISPVLTSQFPMPAKRPLYSVLDTTQYTALTSITPRHWLEAAKEFLNDR